MGGSHIAAPFVKHLEYDVQDISGFIAIDGSKNVIGKRPVTSAPGAGPYSLCKGLMQSVGFAGAVVTQPYQSTGFYLFTFDEPWVALLDADILLLDQGAVATPTPSIKANCRANQNAPDAGLWPGTDPTITPQTLQVRFRLPTTGALTDLAVNTGFWIRLRMRRSAVTP